MEKPVPPFQIVKGIVKIVIQGKPWLGIADGVGNICFLAHNDIISSHPPKPYNQWQTTIFRIMPNIKINWKPEDLKYYDNQEGALLSMYRNNTVPIPEPIPMEYIDALPPEKIVPQTQSIIPNQYQQIPATSYVPPPQQPLPPVSIPQVVQMPKINTADILVPKIAMLISQNEKIIESLGLIHRFLQTLTVAIHENKEVPHLPPLDLERKQ